MESYRAIYYYVARYGSIRDALYCVPQLNAASSMIDLR